MRIDIEEVYASKASYVSYYSELSLEHERRKALVLSLCTDDTFTGSFAESVKEKLYETHCLNIEMLLSYVQEIIHRLERYLEAFANDVDDDPEAYIDTEVYEAQIEAIEEELRFYERIDLELDHLNSEHIEFFEAYGPPLSWTAIEEHCAHLRAFREFCYDVLDRVYAFERAYADFFDDLLDGSFEANVYEAGKRTGGAYHGKYRGLSVSMFAELSLMVTEKPEGMSEATYRAYRSELLGELSTLNDDGFDHAALQAYVRYTNTHVLEQHGVFNPEYHLKTIFTTYTALGSPVFILLFEASQQSADEKLNVVYAHYMKYQKFDRSLKKDSTFFTSLNTALQESTVFEMKEGEAPSQQAAFFHYEMRHYLNYQGAFAPYANFATDEECLQAMADDGWAPVDFDPKADDKNALKSIQNSRYHGMLPAGYASIQEFKDKHGYDPTKNIKLLSKDKKFERIYNLELGKFVDVEPYSITPESVGFYASDDMFRNTANNMPTYNYGYETHKGAKDYHKKVDVNPFNTFKGSMKGITTDTTCYEGGPIELEVNSKKDEDTCATGIDLANTEEMKGIGYAKKLGKQEYTDSKTGKEISFEDGVRNFWSQYSKEEVHEKN